MRTNLTYLVFSHLREPSMVKLPTAIEVVLTSQVAVINSKNSEVLMVLELRRLTVRE